MWGYGPAMQWNIRDRSLQKEMRTYDTFGRVLDFTTVTNANVKIRKHFRRPRAGLEFYIAQNAIGVCCCYTAAGAVVATLVMLQLQR